MNLAGQVAVVGPFLGTDAHQRQAIAGIRTHGGADHPGLTSNRTQAGFVLAIGGQDRQLRTRRVDAGELATNFL